jgi:multidrug efflux pump
VTIAVSVAISGFTALTLTPAMCALMLKHNPPPSRGSFGWFNRQIDRITRGFGHAVEWTIKQTAMALVLLAASCTDLALLPRAADLASSRTRTRAT